MSPPPADPPPAPDSVPPPTDASDEAVDAGVDPKEALAAISLHLRELAAYASQYVSATLSRGTLVAKRVVITLVVLAMLAIVGVTMLVTASVLLIVGIAGALSAPLPDGFAWLGPVLVGLVGAIGVPLLVWLVARRLATAGKLAAAHAYEVRLRAQREAFGIDAADRAAAAEPAVEAKEREENRS